MSGLRRLLGTIGYEGACASGKISCIASIDGYARTGVEGSTERDDQGAST